MVDGIEGVRLHPYYAIFATEILQKRMKNVNNHFFDDLRAILISLERE